MVKLKHNFDLIVIGSGAGGSTAAVAARSAGMKVAIIEAETFGGSAPNHNDIPLGALIQTAHLYNAARRGSRFGISSTTLRYNYPAIAHFKDIVVRRGGGGGNRKFYDNLGIQTLHGLAHFLSPNEISVGNKRFSAKYFLIATGARLKKPDIKNLENIKHLTTKDVISTTRLPRSLFVVGGGRTGVELAQFFAMLGTKVLIAEKSARLVPTEDEEVGAALSKVFNDSYGIKVLTKTKVVATANGSGVKKVTFMRGSEEKTIAIDEVLIATEREPNTDLGLENAGVKYNAHGVQVNEYLQTSMKNIYAVGDVINPHHSTSKAMAQGTWVVDNMPRRVKQPVPTTSVPNITLTYPQVASVGLTEDDCLKRDLKIRKSIAPLSVIARSNVSDFRDGFVKIITSDHGKILGGVIVAPEASSMISELTIAVNHDLLASDLADLPHAFMSWSEAIKVAAKKIG
ncbi:MAG: NAD(P)/FAD-dependent oxidoreductase [Candidatus Nomurabacteria bacterium]|jgi:dihydrolipoamide dehydrogenase|nr:NAD(P)/FAD-dependent oxidoreductase [Candidatus Nomurabacteria bacterium]